MKPHFELAEVIGRFENSFYQQYSPDSYRQNVLAAIKHCRTAVLGGHLDRCLDCGHERISYNSCRNRHCPKCQNSNRELWIERLEQILPAGNYFHVVFTLPESVNGLFIAYKNDMQNLLFEAAWKTIEQFAAMPKYLGAQTGMIAVLHTWGQTLSFHPHLHCIIPEGGLNCRNQWVKGKMAGNDSSFLFPVGQLSQVFRGKFLCSMSRMLKDKYRLPAPCIKEKAFNVYAKKPFRGLSGVVEYLGRYTHKVAITNHRITQVDENGVTFRYKDYREQGVEKQMSLSGKEFLRRFVMHIQNKGFRRIRYYGILAASNRKLLNEIRVSLGQDPVKPQTKTNWKQTAKEKLNYDPDRCPACKTGKMELVRTINPRAPPYFKTPTNQNL